MGWRNDSSAGAYVWDTEPLGREDILCRDEELAWLKRHEQRSWRLVNGRIAQKGDPVMAEGTYGGLLAYPPAQALTAATGVATNIGWWGSTLYTPIPANSILAPDAYRIAATGTITTAGAATLVMNPAIGVTVVNAAPSPANVLGASSSITLGSTITGAFWYLMGDITVRTAGSAGTAYALFDMKIGTTAAASTTITTALFGNTVATCDFTAQMGLVIAAAASATTVSVTPTQIHWMSWN